MRVLSNYYNVYNYLDHPFDRLYFYLTLFGI